MLDANVLKVLGAEEKARNTYQKAKETLFEKTLRRRAYEEVRQRVYVELRQVEIDETKKLEQLVNERKRKYEIFQPLPPLSQNLATSKRVRTTRSYNLKKAELPNDDSL